MISQTDVASKNNTSAQLASCRNFIFCNLVFCNSQLTLFPHKKGKVTLKCQNNPEYKGEVKI